MKALAIMLLLVLAAVGPSGAAAIEPRTMLTWNAETVDEINDLEKEIARHLANGTAPKEIEPLFATYGCWSTAPKRRAASSTRSIPSRKRIRMPTSGRRPSWPS